MQTGSPLSCCERPPIHTLTSASDSQGLASILKVSARSSNVSLPPLTLTHTPPEPLSPAPEQRPGPREQAVHQGDTNVPPLPTVLSSGSWRGQQLQPPVHPPEGGEGGSGHEEPGGRHGWAGGLGPDGSLGPLRCSRSRRIQRALRTETGKPLPCRTRSLGYFAGAASGICSNFCRDRPRPHPLAGR